MHTTKPTSSHGLLAALCCFATCTFGQALAQPSHPTRPTRTAPGTATHAASTAKSTSTSTSTSDDEVNLLLGDDGPTDGAISYEDPLVGYVVVTGSKRRQRTADSVSSISILTKDQISALPYFYLGDLLSALPGVDARWGMMQRYYVGVRGLGSTTSLNSRLLLLWDGIPLNDPFTGGLGAGHFIPLVDLERIEMIRGAGSSMYGANAFSGVVNIITADPAELDPREGMKVSALMGSFLTSRVQVAADETVNKTHVGVSVEAFRTDGPFPRMERATPDGFAEFKNDDVASVATQAHVAYKGFSLRGQYAYGDRGKPGTFVTDSAGHIRQCSTCHTTTEWGRGAKYPAAEHTCGNCHAAPNDRETVQRGGVALLYNRWIGRGFSVAAQAYDNEYRTNYKSTKETAFLGLQDRSLDVRQRAAGGEVRITHSARRNNAVVGGVVRRADVASQMLLTPAGENRASVSNLAGFLEDEVRPAKRISITAGARVDYSTDFGVAFSPRGGIVIKPRERLALRVNASQAFRNPSMSELYVLERRGKYTVSGNADLDREWITSVEGGANYAFQAGQSVLARVGASGFWSRTTALIGIESSGRDIASFINFEPASVTGGELEVDVELKRQPRIRGSLNYSYQRARDSAGARLPYAPSSKGNLCVMASEGNWGLLMRARVVGTRWDEVGVPLDPFATLDLSAQLDLGGNMLMQLWVNNLSDDVGQESLGVPRAARSFFLTLGYRQSK